jgi:hypothetical protein
VLRQLRIFGLILAFLAVVLGAPTHHARRHDGHGTHKQDTPQMCCHPGGMCFGLFILATHVQPAPRATAITMHAPRSSSALIVVELRPPRVRA